MYGIRPLPATRPQLLELLRQRRFGSVLTVSDLTSFCETKYYSKAAPSSPILINYSSTPFPIRVMTTRKAGKMPERDQPAKTSHIAQVLTNMAEATCKVLGLSKKKTKTS
jgi:hypothetical protein